MTKSKSLEIECLDIECFKVAIDIMQEIVDRDPNKKAKKLVLKQLKADLKAKRKKAK